MNHRQKSKDISFTSLKIVPAGRTKRHLQDTKMIDNQKFDQKRKVWTQTIQCDLLI